MSIAPTEMDLSVRLCPKLPVSLKLQIKGQRLVFNLSRDTLNRDAVFKWLRRHDVTLDEQDEETGPEPEYPIFQLPTTVVCCDRRIAGIAESYARATAAPLCHAETAEALTTVMTAAPQSRSVTIFTLNDCLDEVLATAPGRANRLRESGNDKALMYGFLTAFTPEQLAWLVVKTFIIFLKWRPARAVGFAEYHGIAGKSTSRFRCARTGETTVEEVPSPWSSDDIAVMSLCAHGVSFDVSLGDVALCGHSEPRLPEQRLTQAPVCFFDGKCFRLNRFEDSPTELLLAVHASPLLWFLNSCHAIPFAGNAFGDGTGYTFGLLAGAAVGVIGSYLTLPSTRWLNCIFEGLLATGATMGQAAAALCGTEDQESGFDAFLLLGSPDLGILPPQRLASTKHNETLQFSIDCKGCYGVRLQISPEMDGPVSVVSDDGGEVWDNAKCELVEYGCERDLLILFDQPIDHRGWLRLGRSGKDFQVLRWEAQELLRRIDVLGLYPFSAAELQPINECRSLAEKILAYLQLRNLVRSRIYIAVLLATLQAALDRLHAAIADRFLDQVATMDFSFDRESSNGFVAGAVRRGKSPCPTCGAMSYFALDRWLKDETYTRRKDLCANCLGVSMALERSPLEVRPLSLEVSPDEKSVKVSLHMKNRTGGWVKALVAGLPRHGPRELAAGPTVVELEADWCGELTFDFMLDTARRGVISYRFIVLCEASAEFHNFKYSNERIPSEGVS